MSADPAAYSSFAERLLDTGIFSDPWVDGRPRFRSEPVLLSPGEQAELYRAAEQIAAVYNEACRVVDADDSLLESFFCLTPVQRLMWDAARPFWHGVARADVFFTDEGPAVCELNCDTPTGEPEAVLLNQLVAPAHPGLLDPNAGLEPRLLAMIEAVTRHTLGDDAPENLSVGLVYPTELTEDLSLVRLYRRWFERRGWSVAIGSPYNLERDGDAVTLLGTPCHVLLRHYKTDWWGERSPVWLDEAPFPDPLPLAGPLYVALQGELERRCAVVNPFGAVLPQNKRMMAFFWEKLDHFARASQAVIRRLVPYTCRLEAMHREQLSAERELWVLKSDYGAEGDEVIIGRVASQAIWDESLRQAAPGRWVAQRYFDAHTTPAGETVNHGVFLVAGEACGLYARVQAGATDTRAESAPVLVTPSQGAP